MTQRKVFSAGTFVTELEGEAPVANVVSTTQPACVVGVSDEGPPFVPVTVSSLSEFCSKFGDIDGKKFGPLAVSEWLRNASSATFIRVLGIGNGKKRNSDGTVTSAGFISGDRLPSSTGEISGNPYTRKIRIRNSATVSTAWDYQGNVRFLGCYHSESADTTWITDGEMQRPSYLSKTMPILRGILMAPSGVLLHLSGIQQISEGGYGTMNSASIAPGYTDTLLIAGSPSVGNVRFFDDRLNPGTTRKQEFVLILNGHRYPEQRVDDVSKINYITASFDLSSPNYFAKVFNTDPYKIQEAGHYLYAHWDIPPSHYSITGSGLLATAYGIDALAWKNAGKNYYEVDAFLMAPVRPSSTDLYTTTNQGSSTTPNYRIWSDRYRYAKTPWFISQKFSGRERNLFRLHALSAGSKVSTKYKFSVENINPPALQSEYSEFDLVIRDWDDNDHNPGVIESWRKLQLDPLSDRYIAKIIGDLNVYYDFDNGALVQEGTYPNRSNIIRVQVDDDVANGLTDPSAIPMGFRGHPHLVLSGTSVFAGIMGSSTQNTLYASSQYNALIHIQPPPIPMRRTINRGYPAKPTADQTLYWGVQFEHAQDWSRPNDSYDKNESIKSFAKYYPDFTTTTMPTVVGDNWDAPETVANGIQSCDRFHHNKFSLEKIQVNIGPDGLADPKQWESARYVRNGDVLISSTTRGLTLDDFTLENRKYLKYTLFMQGGFDGVNIFNKDMSELTDKAINEEMLWDSRGRRLGQTVTAYYKALDIIQEKSLIDFQVLAVPGIRHPIITDKGVLVVEDRRDSLYVMDVEKVKSDGSIIYDDSLHSVTATVDKFVNRYIDTTYAAAYYPDVLIQNPTNSSTCVVPPSVVILGALALNDKLGFPWFAPAGFTRGALETTLEPRSYLSQVDIDNLSKANINPLIRLTPSYNLGTVNFAGVTVWGQKTLMQTTSALNRVNVRRLLIDIKRKVNDVAQGILFEQNRDETLAKFDSLTTPILRKIQAQAGLDRFKVIIDTSTTTQQDIENNTIRGKIFVQPTKSIDQISIDFVVSNSI